MSVATDSILKLLSDLSASADKIIEEDVSEIMGTRVSEWTSTVENKADSIEESESGADSEKIPSLMSFLKGGTSQRGPRASTVLTEIERLHLHKNKKESIKRARKSRRSSIKSDVKKRGTYETLLVHSENETPKLKRIFNQNGTSSSTFTPADEESTASQDKKSRGKSKRKSSSGELSFENIKKKPKQISVNDAQGMEKSMRNYPRADKLLIKAKNSSLLPSYANIKSSVGNVSILKERENRILRSKLETKQDKAVENRKNIMALRQQKLEESKRTRQEKIESIEKQRLKLEKQKPEKLRSGKQEKTLKTPKAMQKTVAENETVGEISKKNPMKSQNRLEKHDGTLPKDKTPGVKKNPKNAPGNVLNATYVTKTEEPSTSKKGKTLKDISNDSNKTQTPHSHKGTKRPLIEKQNQNTPAEKKGPESYAITPARSSFVSYDISEIRSDSEEEEQETNSKPIPSWATGVRLRNALLQQFHCPIDTDELFGNVVENPDLGLIMGVKKKQYNKRTSSAVWNVSFSTN